jgi:hypothetical protein
MRTVGLLNRALDMMCERALSRHTKGELLSQKQMTQEKIADSYTQITQFRLHVLYAAWLIDKHQSYNREVRREIAAVKAAMPGVLRDVVCNQIPTAFHDHRPYAVCAFAGGWVYVGLWQADAPGWLAMIACVTVTAGLRGLALWRNWQLPAWKV